MLCKLLSEPFFFFFFKYDRVDSDTNALCVSARTTFHDQHLSRDIPQLSRYFCGLETLKLLKTGLEKLYGHYPHFKRSGDVRSVS